MKLCGAMVKNHLFKQELSSSKFYFQKSFFSWMISLDELCIVCPYGEMKKVGFDDALNVRFSPLFWSNCQGKKIKMGGPSFLGEKINASFLSFHRS